MWKVSTIKKINHLWHTLNLRLVKFHQGLKYPVLQYLIILVALFSSLMIVYFSFGYEFSWQRLRLPAKYSAGVFDLESSKAENLIKFQGLVQSCDRISSFEAITVTQFSESDNIGMINNQVVLVSTLEDTFDFPITKPLREGQVVQIWSTSSNKLTLDISNCKNADGTLNNSVSARSGNCQECLSQTIPGQVQINLTELKIRNGEFFAITILNLICLSFCALGLLFFIFQPNRLITAVHCLFFNTVALALVVHNSTYYHTGSLERVLSIVTFQLIPPLFLHFVLLFPDGEPLSKSAKRFVKFSYLSIFGILIIELYGNLVPDSDGNYVYWEAAVRKLRYLEFGILFASAITILVIKYLKSKRQSRVRLRLAVLSLFVGAMPVFIVFLLNSLFGMLQDWTEHNFALLLIPALLIPGGFGYAVVKNKLLGVDLKVRRVVVRSILIGLVTILYLILTPLLSSLFSFWTSIENNPIFQVILIIALNELCNRFRNILNTLIDKAFAVDPLDYNGLARKWSNNLAKTTELDKTFSSVIAQLPQDYHYKRAALLLCQPQLIQIKLKSVGSTIIPNNSVINSLMVSSSLRQYTSNGQSKANSKGFLDFVTLEISKPVLDYVKQEDWILFGYSKLPAFVEYEVSKMGFETNVIIPLNVGGEFYGALFLGEKTGEYSPPPNELDFLSNIATQISASIHNSLLLTEAKAIAEKEKVIRLMSEARTRRDQQVRQKTLSEVADDLHGGPLQDLFYLQQNLEQVSKDINVGLPLNTYDFNVYTQRVREVISKMRRTTTELRLYGVEKDFINGIRRLIKDFNSSHGEMEFNFTVNTTLPVDEILAEQVKFALFRAIQEALNNALKHSQASKVEVSFELDHIEPYPSSDASISATPNLNNLISQYLIEVRISDNGKGIDKDRLLQFNSEISPEQEYEQLEKGEHLGIGIIKQQVGQFSELYQSEINFYSTDSAGFEVAIALYIPAEPVEVDQAVSFTLTV